jgi:Fe-S cluster assembly scaffold protein SufB
MRRQISHTVRGELDQKFWLRAADTERKQIKLTIRHTRPDTSSKVAVLIVASDQARVALDATVVIEPTARNTQAWLEIRVLTSAQALVTAAPNLEIRHNAVKAGHALTTKHISDEELFYLASRGLTAATAEQLVTAAAIQPFTDESVVQL